MGDLQPGGEGERPAMSPATEPQHTTRTRDAESIRDEAARILGMVVIPLLVLALFLVAINETVAWFAGRGAQMRAVAASRAAALEQYLTLHRAAVMMAADDVAQHRSSVPGGTDRDVLKRARRAYPGLRTMLVADADGTVVVAETDQDDAVDRALSSARSSIADRDYFRQVAASRQPHLSGVLRGRRLGNDLIVAAVAPIIVDGRFEGIVQGALDVGRLDDLITSDSLDHIGLTVDLVDQFGRVVVSVGRYPQDALQQHVASNRRSVQLEVDGLGWTLAVRDDVPWYAGAVQRIWLVTCAGIVALLLVLRWLLRLLASRITGPLEELARRVAAVDVDAGDLDRAIADDPPDSPREVQAISGAVARLLGRIAAADAARTRALLEADSANRVLSRVVAERGQVIARQTAALEAALREARDAVAAKDRMLANTSHEIRTPLVAVLGHAELLLVQTDDPSVRARLESIIRNANSLLSLMDDLLAFARAHFERKAVANQPFDPCSLVSNVTATFAAAAAEKGLELKARVDPGTPCMVSGDERRCEQVLSNLVSNAVKYTAVGHVEVAVGMDGPDRIRYTVTDTGIGLDAGESTRAFEPFVRGAAAATGIEGAGLGLSIVRELVQHLGGTIDLASTPGVGSRFTVSLPVGMPQGPVSAAGRAKVPDAPGVVLDVLVVDDNDVSRDVVAAQVESLGHRASTAVDGETALALIRAGRHQLVLLDCRMPGMDGYEVARRLRDSPPPERPWIVGFTAQVQDGERERCLAAGMDDYRPKPMRLSDLRELLAQIAGGRRD